MVLEKKSSSYIIAQRTNLLLLLTIIIGLHDDGLINFNVAVEHRIGLYIHTTAYACMEADGAAL
jgi:hypothetical protein